MVIEERCLIGVEDLMKVHFECTNCNAAIVIPVKRWTKVPFQCPACGTTWDTQHEDAMQRLTRFAQAITSVAANPPERVKLRLELERRSPPKTTG